MTMSDDAGGSLARDPRTGRSGSWSLTRPNKSPDWFGIEMRLAAVELQRNGKRLGVGAGLLGGAGVLAFYGGAALMSSAGRLLQIAGSSSLRTTFVVLRAKEMPPHRATAAVCPCPV
jgi:hypothetical protein